MEASDLINYKEQVATIESALQADPTNEELLTLKAELLELITLTETLLQQEQEQQQPAAQATTATEASESSSSSHTAAASSHPSNLSPQSASGSGSGVSTPNAAPPSTAKPPPESNQPIYQPPAPLRHWSTGDRCRALYKDGKFYEAKILAVGGGGQVYTVAFKGYESSPPALVGPQDLKAIYDPKKHQKHDHNKAGAGAATATAATAAGDGSSTSLTQKKRGPDSAGSEGGPKKKKSGSQTASEQVQKQMAWQNFAKGGAKKTKGPALKKSIFATPDNPEGKVGVVGSGKGMTSFQQRGKHIYGNAPQSR